MKKKLQLVTAHEVSIKLGVRPRSISRLIRTGRISGFKLANRWLVEQSTIDNFSKNYVGKKGRPKGYSPGKRKK